MNVQVITDPAGRLIWASDALPGTTHDLTAARTHGIPAAPAADDIKCWGQTRRIRVLVLPSASRSGERTCAAGTGVTTGTTTKSAAWTNVPRRSSSAGGSCRNPTAAPPGSQPSSEPSPPSDSPTDQDGKRSLPCWRVDSGPSYDRETQGPGCG
ncbi:hypothetical protein [Streptomyces enissocaesilis]|uniref:hypothetical protein n=1 Tax=Streptomyces enissocaesilis TaxID=332589 RepID=UPI003CD06286